LDKAPVTALSQLPPRSAVLLDAPCEIQGVVVFNARWDLQRAMQYYRGFPRPDIRFLTQCKGSCHSLWNGKTIKQFVNSDQDKSVTVTHYIQGPHNKLWQFPAKHLYIWKYPSGEITVPQKHQPI
jgi:hypothetical protein